MMRLLLLLTTLLAAGCVGGEDVDRAARPTPPTPVDEPEPLAPAPRMNVTQFNGSIAGAGHPGVGYVRAQGENVFTFDLPANVTAMVVEVAWAGGDALDVQLSVPAAHCQKVDPAGLLRSCPSPPPDADGQSPARIEVLDAEQLARTGEWRLGVWARSSARAAPFTAYVTLFEDGKPAATFTAVPAG